MGSSRLPLRHKPDGLRSGNSDTRRRTTGRHNLLLYTVIENLTLDGRDRSLDYKLSHFNFAKGSWESRVVEAITRTSPSGDSP